MPGVEEPPRRVVADASVVVRWFVAEPGSDAAAALLEQAIAWTAPRLMLTEVAAALRRKVAGGELGSAEATQDLEVLHDMTTDGTLDLAADELLIRSAFALSLALGHKVPDCLYLALAERRGAALATADRRLAGLARDRGLEVLAVPSSA